MKFVRTARRYQTLTVPGPGEKTVVVNRSGVELSEEDTKTAQELAERAGVEIEVSDKEFEAEAERVTVGQQTPDLSAGRGAVTGTGAPVQTIDSPAEAEAAAEDGEAGMDPDANPPGDTATGTATRAAAKTAAARSGEGVS